MSELAERIARLTPAQQELLRLRAQRTPPAKDGIAVIGMACRFPGANDTDAYWSLLRDGIDAISMVPSERYDVASLYDPRPATPGRMNTRWAGLLEGIDDFDPEFFNIAPREAVRMDPQQRLLLEVAWEALEDAGQPVQPLAGSQTGVFIGICGGDFGRAQANDLQAIDAYVATGGASSIAANRLSYFLDLRGPSMAVDTACSSSLVALHLAAQSLRRRECDLALVGGVNALLTPEMTIAFSQAHMMSADGRCKTFDASADGYVRGEGCGVLVLRRLEDARASNSRIRALVRGSAINQDGRSNGLTAPNGPAQQAVIRQCLADAALDPAHVGYVEVHGTGTPLGDPIEVHALSQVYTAGRRSDQPCVLGSAKTNIGHLEAAAGMAGMIKVILAMEHGQIPPHLHLKTLNPRISIAGMPIRIATELSRWPAPPQGRLGGVSSFGFGGTNAHVILGDPPEGAPSTEQLPERPAELLTLSARSVPALRAMAAAYADHLTAHPEIAWPDVCYSAQSGRSQFEHRLALVAPGAAQASADLRAIASGAAPRSSWVNHVAPGRKPHGVVFLFTGQGAQYAGMGRGLYAHEAVFREALDRCAELSRPWLDRPLLDILFAAPGERALVDDTAYTQPALFSLAYALCQLWRSWGVRPSAVIGHSVGEYGAACAAGVFSVADGLQLITERARLMHDLSRDGAMAAVFTDQARVAAALADGPGGIDIAATNGTQETVVSGPAALVERLLVRLSGEGIAATRLTVSHAFHSSALDPMLRPFATACARVVANKPSIPLVSNLTGGFADEALLGASDYWCRHARGTVRFDRGMRTLAERSYSVFLEIGPHPILSALGGKLLVDRRAEWLPSLHRGRDECEQMLSSLGRLHVLGEALDWTGVGARRSRRRVPLPHYPFERQRMHSCPVHQGTHAPSLGQTQQDGAADASAHVHPLLGRRIISPVTDVVQFSARVSSASSPYLRDHRVYGAVLLPATAFLDMALAAGEALGLRQCVLEQVVISKPFQVPDDERALLHLAVRVPPAPAPATVQIFSRQVESAAIGTTSSAAPVWVLHAQATLGAAGGAPSGPEVPTLSEARAACTTEIASRDFYRSLSDRGFAYGPAFQGMVQAWIGPGVAVAHVVLPDAGHAAGSGYVIHPAMLDACCQVLATLAPAPSAGHAELFVPVGLDALSRSGDIGTDVWTVVAVRPGTHASHGVLVADVHLFDAAGACLARVAGLRFARVTREALLGTAPPPVHATASAFIPPLRRTLQSTAGDARSAILRAFIIERIATIIGRANDQIDATKPLNAMGFDSLMAGELSLDIEDALGLVIPMERFRDVPTIDRIIALLLDHLATEQHPHDDAPGTVDAMSDEEVERQLRARLERPGA